MPNPEDVATDVFTKPVSSLVEQLWDSLEEDGRHPPADTSHGYKYFFYAPDKQVDLA